jgi:putative ABC transport system ATP-binding protein
MLDQNLSRYIWTHTKTQQLWILLVVAVSMIPYFLSFNLPKQIVNGPIQGEGFADPDSTQRFMRIEFDLPFYGNVLLYDGVELTRLGMLMALSAVFLGLVIINGLFKFYINTYKGKLGERMLRRVRFTLVDHILRFPPATFKRLKGAEISSMVKDEVEPLGGFTGDAFVAPALLGGQALTALVFIFVQSVMLGFITAALVSVQVFIIPKMRRRLLVLGRERQLTARELAGRVSEIVDGINTIHSYDTSNYERADIASRLGRIYKIRFDIYQWKFLVKFINNFLASVTPFLFYSVGGYLALNGKLDIGQLVAVIGAYKDLPGPLKELIDWDQNRQDVQVKYHQVISQFAVDDMIQPEIQELSTADVAGRLIPPLAAVNLGVVDENGTVGLQRVNFALRPGETVAIVGNSGSGSDLLAEALARIVWPTSGKIVAGDADLHALPESVSGRTITYADQDTYFFFGTLRDNLLYGLKHAPLTLREYEGRAEAIRHREQKEAQQAGNPDFDLKSDWIDYSSIGADGPDGVLPAVFAVLDAVTLTKDILDLALYSVVNPAENADLPTKPADSDDLPAKIVAMRQVLREELTTQDLQGLIVPFEPGAYNVEATVIENLLFGNARTPALMAGAITTNAYFRKVLDDQRLADKLFVMGVEVARNAVELFSDLPPDHPFFQQLTFMTADDIPAYQLLLQKLDSSSAVASDTDRADMIRLSFNYIEPRHRFGLLTADLMAEIVTFRGVFHEGLPDDLRDAIELYDPDRYIVSGTLLDNMLFGRISQKYRDGADRIHAIVADLLPRLGIYETVLSVGLTFHVGAAGKRLSSAQRQKLSLARALIRRSDYYLFNRPLSALDGRLQMQILQNALAWLRADGRSPGIAWVVSSTNMTRHFERIAVFDRGALVEDGTYDDLVKKNGIFKEMIAA